MDEKLVRFTLRIDRLLFQKVCYIAEYDVRSINKEIEQFIKKCVAEFEKEHGKIKVEV